MKHRSILAIVAILLVIIMASTGCEELNTPLAIERDPKKKDEAVDPSDIAVDLSAATASGSAAQQDERSVTDVTGIVSGGSDVSDDHEVTTIVYEMTEVTYRKKDVTADYDKDAVVHIALKKDSITVNGPGATPDGRTVTITDGGDYLVTGELKNGQIIVDAGKNDDVRLILSGVTISCKTSSPIYCKKADKLIITLDAGSVNTLKDGDEHVYDDEEAEEPNAVIFSDCDLSINGSGQLDIEAIFDHGIRCKDTMKLVSGIVNITSKGAGIKVRNGLVIKSGTISIKSEGDGIKSGIGDATTGYVVIDGGILTIDATCDGIQTGSSLEVKDGTVDITSGGGSVNSSTGSNSFGWGFWGSSKNEDSTSAKALKSKGNIYIMSGTLRIDSSDDSIHADKDVSVNGGTLTLASGDDGIHAGQDLTINGGSVTVSKSYEGLEGLTITINGGIVSVKSDDDGMNAAGGDGSSTTATGGRNRGFDNPFAVTDGACITINGGYVYVDAEGDGIDSNGDLYVTGGTIMVDGPTRGGNGALDHNGVAQITGGTIVASGSSDMIENFGETSTQNVVLIYFNGTAAAGTVVTVKNESGEEVLSFTAGKTSQCAVMSSPLFKTGAAYTVLVGADELTTFTIESVISTPNGSSQSGWGFGRGNGGGFPWGNPGGPQGR